jgi:uncharacterized protein
VNRIYRGHVYHTRREPSVNSFTYPSVFCEFDFPIKSNLNLFSIEKMNLFSISSLSYGFGGETNSFSSLEEKIRNLFLQNSLGTANSKLSLVTMPKIFGYAFNPVSFWILRSSEGEIEGILSEVNNTFGERHFYLIAGALGTAQKCFHVSPFYPIEGQYKFNFKFSENEFSAQIDLYKNEILSLHTRLAGQAQALSDIEILKTCISQPFTTFLVVYRIHYQALRLWLKKVPFFRKPNPPEHFITTPGDST